MVELTYSRQQIESWQSKLEEIASLPRTTFTKRQAVEELIDTIEMALLSRSFGEVAESLSEWGLDISEGSLKQYVTRYRKGGASKGGASKGARASAKRRASDRDKQGRSPAVSAASKAAGKTVGKATTKAAARTAAETVAQKGSRRKTNGNVLAALETGETDSLKGFLDMPDDL